MTFTRSILAFCLVHFSFLVGIPDFYAKASVDFLAPAAFQIKTAQKLNFIRKAGSTEPQEIEEVFQEALELSIPLGLLDAMRTHPEMNERLFLLGVLLFSATLPMDFLKNEFHLSELQIQTALQNLIKRKILVPDGPFYKIEHLNLDYPLGAYRSINATQALFSNDALILKALPKDTDRYQWLAKKNQFSQAVLGSVFQRTVFGEFLMNLWKKKPQTYSLLNESDFTQIWNDLESKLNPSGTHLSLAQKLDLLAENESGRAKLEGAVFQHRHNTTKTRLLLENNVLIPCLIANGVSPKSSVVLEQGASSMVSAKFLQEMLGGRVIGSDLSPLETIYERSGGRVNDATQLEDTPESLGLEDGVLEFRRGDMAGDFFEDLQGKVDLIRHTNVLHYLPPNAFHKTVENVFKYARNKTMLYHVGKADTGEPGLFDQLIFNIHGSGDANDWDLVYVGYLGASGVKEHNIHMTQAQLQVKELEFSRLVLNIFRKSKYIALALGLNEYQNPDGKLSKDGMSLLLESLFPTPAQSIDQFLMKEIFLDILRISPWTPPDEYTRSFYRENNVKAPHELTWETESELTHNVFELLTGLDERLNPLLASSYFDAIGMRVVADLAA